MVTSLNSELWTMKCVQPPSARSLLTFTAVLSVETAPKPVGAGQKQNAPAEIAVSARRVRFSLEFNLSGFCIFTVRNLGAGSMPNSPLKSGRQGQSLRAR